jgi:membrane-bound lytic murein transglycosylase A
MPRCVSYIQRLKIIVWAAVLMNISLYAAPFKTHLTASSSHFSEAEDLDSLAHWINLNPSSTSARPSISHGYNIDANALQAFKKSCQRLVKDQAWQAVCLKAQQISNDQPQLIQKFFMNAFAWSPPKKGLLTGYYEPIIEGSLHYSESFSIPVYGPPVDLHTVDLPSHWDTQTVLYLLPASESSRQWMALSNKPSPNSIELRPGDFTQFPIETSSKKLKGRIEGNRFIPFYSRSDIQNFISHNPLLFHAPILAWVHDPVDLFFMQVQGSGIIQLQNGTHLRLSFADHNGYKYTSIANHLLATGALNASQVSMQTIRAWISVNPEQGKKLMGYNPSYVFFKINTNSQTHEGPHGAQSVPLTAGYSLAVDAQSIPLGSPVWIESFWPNGQPLKRLVIAQDTGSAIKGEARADLFLGTGKEAGDIAGKLKHSVSIHVLKPL